MLPTICVTTGGYVPLRAEGISSLAALKRDGWAEIRRVGSHRTLERGGRRVTWAHHHGEDLGNAARIAKAFGYGLDDLRGIL